VKNKTLEKRVYCVSHFPFFIQKKPPAARRLTEVLVITKNYDYYAEGWLLMMPR